MRTWHLIGLIALNATGCLCCPLLHAAEPTKPIQQCEAEFQARKASLLSKGVSASSFFHECWWHSRVGQPTEMPSDGARDRITRIQGDPQAARVRTAGRGNVRPPIGGHDHVARLDERHARRREARLQRRVNHLLATRSRHLVLTAEARRVEGKRLRVADARKYAALEKARDKRLAFAASRVAERRERFALRREQGRGNESRAIADTSADIPAGALAGRRSWIGTPTISGKVKVPAVMVGSLRTAAVKGTALHCWDQNVLYLSGTAHWQQSLVCDDKTASSAQNVWFEQ